MHLKHAFWSILDHITYFASGRSCFKVSIQRTRLIPVAIGTTKQPAEVLTPKIIIINKVSFNKYFIKKRFNCYLPIYLITSKTKEFVSLFIKLDPAALG